MKMQPAKILPSMQSVKVNAAYDKEKFNVCWSLLFSPFIPEFLKWTLPSLNLDTSIEQNTGFNQKSITDGKQCRS